MYHTDPHLSLFVANDSSCHFPVASWCNCMLPVCLFSSCIFLASMLTHCGYWPVHHVLGFLNMILCSPCRWAYCLIDSAFLGAPNDVKWHPSGWVLDDHFWLSLSLWYRQCFVWGLSWLLASNNNLSVIVIPSISVGPGGPQFSAQSWQPWLYVFCGHLVFLSTSHHGQGIRSLIVACIVLLHASVLYLKMVTTWFLFIDNAICIVISLLGSEVIITTLSHSHIRVMCIWPMYISIICYQGIQIMSIIKFYCLPGSNSIPMTIFGCLLFTWYLCVWLTCSSLLIFDNFDSALVSCLHLSSLLSLNDLDFVSVIFLHLQTWLLLGGMPSSVTICSSLDEQWKIAG